MDSLRPQSGFAAVEIEPVQLQRDPLLEMYRLSPPVWAEDSQYRLLIRAINRSQLASKKVASSYYGTLYFRLPGGKIRCLPSALLTTTATVRQTRPFAFIDGA